MNEVDQMDEFVSTGEKLFALATLHDTRVGRDLRSGAWYFIHPVTQVKFYAGTQMECYEHLQEVVQGVPW